MRPVHPHDPYPHLAAKFEVPDPPLLATRFNVAPSQLVAVVGLKPDGVRRGLALLKWGLVPSWANDPTSGPKPINVRAETALAKFGEQLRGKRCLIPADGQWATVGGKKLPRRFTMKSGEPFALAGLWDTWRDETQTLTTCCLITTGANELVSAVHDRMPVILDRESYAEWLDPETPEERLVALLKPYPADAMQVTAANPVVNSPKNDGPERLEAA